MTKIQHLALFTLALFDRGRSITGLLDIKSNIVIGQLNPVVL